MLLVSIATALLGVWVGPLRKYLYRLFRRKISLNKYTCTYIFVWVSFPICFHVLKSNVIAINKSDRRRKRKIKNITVFL